MKVFDSKDVAKVLGKRHDNLLREIRKYSEILGEKAPQYFLVDGEGRKSTFKFTVAGCELLAGKMIGDRGDKFRAWYTSPDTAFVEEQDNVPPPPAEYSVSEVASILGISERTVYNWVKSGKLASIQREIMIPTMKTFITAEVVESFKEVREVS